MSKDMDEALLARMRERYMKLSKEELVERYLEKTNREIDGLVRTEGVEEINEVRESIRKVVRDSILQVAKNKEFIKKLLLRKSYDDKSDEPTEFAKSLFTDLVNEEFLNEFRESIKEYLMEHYELILKKVLLSVFMQGIANNNVVQSAISDAIYNYND